MPEWTRGAQDVLQAYLDRLLESLGENPDAAEVVADVESHVREEVSHLNLSVVTAEDMSAVLGRVGTPEILTPQKPAEPVETTSHPKPEPHATPKQRGRSVSTFWYIFVYLFAVLFSLAAIGVALPYSSALTEVLVNPFPTFVHAILCLAAVAGVVVGLHTFKAGSRTALSVGTFASGVTLGVSGCYIVAFFPLIPFFVLAVILFGLGLVALAPLWCFLAAIRHAVSIAAVSRDSGLISRGRFATLLLVGIFAPLTFLIGYELHEMKMDNTLRAAASDDASARAEAIETLRSYASEEDLRRRCYYVSEKNRRTLFGYIFALSAPTGPTMEEYRTIYYRVHGKPFNSKPIPQFRLGVRTTVDWQDEWQANWTAGREQGGEEVGGRVRDLSLASSHISGTLDSKAAVAYLEWTMEFRNKSKGPREARMQIAIPHNAVASEMVLWIDGEKRRAALAPSNRSARPTRPLCSAASIRHCSPPWGATG